MLSDYENKIFTERLLTLKYSFLFPICPTIGFILLRRYYTFAFYTVLFVLSYISLLLLKGMFLPFFILFFIINSLYLIFDMIYGKEHRISPCVYNCPVNMDIDTLIHFSSHKKYDEMEEYRHLHFPFPYIMCILCHSPCEFACPRQRFDRSLSIKMIFSSYLGGYDVVFPSIKYDKIAVIGGGISGLSVAFYLRMFGFDVDIFEKNDELLGRLRYAQSFSLPKSHIIQTLKEIDKWDIKKYYNVEVGKDVDISEIKRHYKYVVFATGKSFIKKEKDIVDTIFSDVKRYLLYKNKERNIFINIKDQYGIFSGIEFAIFLKLAGFKNVVLCLPDNYDERFSYYIERCKFYKIPISECGDTYIEIPRSYDIAKDFSIEDENMYVIDSALFVSDAVNKGKEIAKKILEKEDMVHYLKIIAEDKFRITPVFYKLYDAAWNYSYPPIDKGISFRRLNKDDFGFPYIFPSKEEITKESKRCMMCYRRYH